MLTLETRHVRTCCVITTIALDNSYHGNVHSDLLIAYPRSYCPTTFEFLLISASVAALRKKLLPLHRLRYKTINGLLIARGGFRFLSRHDLDSYELDKFFYLFFPKFRLHQVID